MPNRQISHPRSITESISGIVDRVTYHNPDTGWSVLRITPFNNPHQYETVTVHQTKVFAGATMEFHGAWTVHPKFGRQFKAVRALEKKPATTAALQKYLGSGLIKGVGPKMGALLVAETHIENCTTPSKLWAWWGLHVVDGRAASRKAGEKASYSPFRKAKMVKVLAESLIKQKSPGYYDAYLSYKHRKETQQVAECMACKGEGLANRKNEETGKTEKVECWNCGGTGGPAPWGVTPEHRHRTALRYMVKRLLLDMWRVWRELEGLEVVPSYAEACQSETHPER